jgi:hypothetical protein
VAVQDHGLAEEGSDHQLLAGVLEVHSKQQRKSARHQLGASPTDQRICVRGARQPR